MHNILFFHTSERHIQRFDDLIAPYTRKIKPVHIVREDLLQKAQKEGFVSENILHEIEDIMRYNLADSIKKIVMTCSTLGEIAEKTPQISNRPVIRLDSLLLEHAKQSPKPLKILYTAPSTKETTYKLFTDFGFKKSDIEMTFIPDAWEYFLHNQLEQHDHLITECVTQSLTQKGSIILAQASMNHILQNFSTQDQSRILSGPELAIEYLKENL